MADITIGIVASAREWRSVLQAHVRDHVAGVRVQILREPRMALELDLDVVVVDDVSSFLTRDKVVRLREKGTRVVGIYDPEGQEGLGVHFLENLGVDLSLPSNISPEEMINAVSQLQPRATYSNAFDHIVADYASPAAAQTGESTLIALSGPSGTGTTEIAIALADVLVARRQATLLLDCDEVGPSVARRLGFHLHPNILSAIDTVNNVTKPLTEMVGRPSDRAAQAVNFDVIPGIANPEDWAQLRPMDMDDLFAAVRKSWRYIVCNTGPFAEDLSGYGIERFGSTRATLGAADVIVGVMSPTPTGYLRFLDWMASLRTIGAERPVYVVVNNAPKSTYVRNEIESQLARDVDARFVAGIFFISADDKVSKAEWEGQRVPRGPFLTGVAELATFIAPMQYSQSKKSAKPVQTYSAPPSTGYESGFTGTPQPVSVSWDDPDIANPPAPQAQHNSAPSSLDEPQAFFNAEHPVEDERRDVEDHLAQTMPVQNLPSETPPAPQSEIYSYSPPLHSTESISAPAPIVEPQSRVVEPQAPSVGGDGYVPAFKRGEENPNTSSFVSSPAPEATVQNYTAEPQPSEQAKQPQGYVPHFLDEKQADEGDEKFWS